MREPVQAQRPKLRCPICLNRVIGQVVESREDREFYWRRRRCEICGEVFTTRETVEPLDRPRRPKSSSVNI